MARLAGTLGDVLPQNNTGILEMEWAPRDPDRKAAWELYVELLTRIATQYLAPITVTKRRRSTPSSSSSISPAKRPAPLNRARSFVFAGKVRQGLNPASRAALFNKMKRLVTARCPFCNLPTSKKSHFGEGITADDMKKLRWLKPQLVAEVRFTEWTSYGLLRHATFAGLRDDKEPAEVIREQI